MLCYKDLFFFLLLTCNKDHSLSASSSGYLNLNNYSTQAPMFVKFLSGHKLNIQLMPRESPRSGSSSSPVVSPPTVMLSCFWEEGFFSASLSFRMPLPSHSPSFRRCHILPHSLWCPLPSLPLHPLTPPCVTGFFLITDPSSCYYSNPLLYNMPFYMSSHKGPIWSEGYGVRSWEMQLHGGNLCLGQNGGLTSSLLTHSSGHSGPSLTCWAHWIQ